MCSPLNVSKTLGKVMKNSFCRILNTNQRPKAGMLTEVWIVSYFLLVNPLAAQQPWRPRGPLNYNRCEKELPSSHWRGPNGTGSSPTPPFAKHCPCLNCLASPRKHRSCFYLTSGKTHSAKTVLSPGALVKNSQWPCLMWQLSEVTFICLATTKGQQIGGSYRTDVYFPSLAAESPTSRLHRFSVCEGSAAQASTLPLYSHVVEAMRRVSQALSQGH